jgi:hypothetical protein
MWRKKCGRWLVWLGVVVGCNAKLSVDPGTGGAGGMTTGMAGKSADDAGSMDSPGVPAGGGAAEQAGGAGFAGTIAAGAVGVEGGAAGSGARAGMPDQPDPGNGGFGGALPGPGESGQPCIPGGTIDTGGGVAATKTATLDRCFAGLSCNSAGKCAATPNCPKTTGNCVEYDTGAGGNGGSGFAGAGFDGSGTAGAGGGVGPGEEGSGPLPTRQESGVTALAIDDTHLYWLEYGTRDSLGNYQNDGALMAMSLADGTKKKLATAIPGPNALGITNGQAYVMVDGAALVGAVEHLQLLRFPLTGGTSQLIQDGSPPLLSRRPTIFAAVGSTAYWTGPNSLYSVASDSALPTVVATGYVDGLHADATDLYFDDGSAHISRTSLTPGSMVERLGLDLRPFDLNGDFIYGLEDTNNGIILTKTAKSGGSWLRVIALGERFPTRLVFTSDRLFVEWRGSDHLPGVTTTTLGSTAPPIRLLDPVEGFVKSWVGTTSKVYWTDGRRIYSRAIPTP